MSAFCWLQVIDYQGCDQIGAYSMIQKDLSKLDIIVKIKEKRLNRLMASALV